MRVERVRTWRVHVGEPAGKVSKFHVWIKPIVHCCASLPFLKALELYFAEGGRRFGKCMYVCLYCMYVTNEYVYYRCSFSERLLG